MKDLKLLADRIRRAAFERGLGSLNVSKCSICGKEVCFYFFQSRTWDVLFGPKCNCTNEFLKPSSWLEVAKFYSEQDMGKKEALDEFFGFEPKFKPFDKVLIKQALSNDRFNFFWKADFFSHMKGSTYVCVGGLSNECIPYEGNEHLLEKESDYKNNIDLDKIIVRDSINVKELDADKFI